MTTSTNRPETDEPPARFGDVLRQRPFAVLYAAETCRSSVTSSARVALAALVFSRTGNAAATALTYATTFLPAIVGGFLLAGVGDRFSKKLVMIACDVARAGLFAVMALPGMPIWSLLVILIVAVFLEPVFGASEVSYLVDALTLSSTVRRPACE